MIKCIRCGKCCYLPDGRKCPYLTEKKLCSVYSSRIGRTIGFYRGQRYICAYREQQGTIIEGCPYNEIIIAGKKKR